MNRFIRFFLVWTGILIFGTACSLVPASSPGSIQFQDDFESEPSGWSLRDDPSGSVEISGGVLRLTVSEPAVSIVTTAGLDLNDSLLSVEALKLAGPDDNSFGLVCRYIDPANFYFYQISSDGYFALGRVQDGEVSLFGNPLMQPHPAIQQGDQINDLGMGCKDNQISAYANGELMAVFEDSSFQSGDVGVIAGTIGSPGVEIGFDLFYARQP